MSNQNLARVLRAHLHGPHMWSLLTPFECGWLDGGCLPLAQALVAWLGPKTELWAVRDNTGRAQHVVARLDGMYLDGDGISSETVLLDRWRRLERIVGATLTPFATVEAPAAGIFVSPALAASVLAALRAWRDGPIFATSLTCLQVPQG